MPRKLRVEYEGAVYHVMSRGDQRERIYVDDADRRRFLETLGEACAKAEWQLHAYCLMGNHFHMVLETPRANLSAGMASKASKARHRFGTRKVIGLVKACMLQRPRLPRSCYSLKN